MARAAGDSGTYEFYLLNKSTGRYDPSCKISFDSVTTVIGSTLAKPFLVPWAFQHGLDVIHGLTDQMGGDELLALLSDDEELKEFMKVNKLRPEDIRDEAADRGKEEHGHLERLANLYLDSDDLSTVDKEAQRFLDSENGYRRATGQWWTDHRPDVLSCETKLLSLEHRFMGTCDLILKDRVVVDLKSRRKGLKMYDSDDIQTGAYQIADAEMQGNSIGSERYVLIIHDDGTYNYEKATIDPTAFLDLLSVHRKRKGV